MNAVVIDRQIRWQLVMTMFRADPNFLPNRVNMLKASEKLPKEKTKSRTTSQVKVDEEEKQDEKLEETL